MSQIRLLALTARRILLALFRDPCSGVDMRRNLLIGVSLVIVLAGLGLAQAVLGKIASAQTKTTAQAPYYEVDPLWPKPLPNHWVLGAAIGVSVDAQDHIWIIHRGSSTLAMMEKELERKNA